MTNDFVELHCTANQAESTRVAELFKSAGISVRERVIHEIGHAEFVIDVDANKIDQANSIFWGDVGTPTRNFTSGQ